MFTPYLVSTVKLHSYPSPMREYRSSNSLEDAERNARHPSSNGADIQYDDEGEAFSNEVTHIAIYQLVRVVRSDDRSLDEKSEQLDQ